MAKLIGKGKDPRLMKGMDFDVPDAQVEHYESAGLGDQVDPATEPERIHPTEKIIEDDPSKDEERRIVAAHAGSAGDHDAIPEDGGEVAARVESTSPAGGGGRKRSSSRKKDD
jgi:hypothetical protein